jgi:hypothetical protein
VDLGYKVLPPLLGRALVRPKVQRIRGSIEKNKTKKKVRCNRLADTFTYILSCIHLCCHSSSNCFTLLRCRGFGHFAKTCKLQMVGEDGEIGGKPSKGRNKR